MVLRKDDTLLIFFSADFAVRVTETENGIAKLYVT